MAKLSVSDVMVGVQPDCQTSARLPNDPRKARLPTRPRLNPVSQKPPFSRQANESFLRSPEDRKELQEG